MEKEINETDRHWNGWYAAIDENGAAGAGGGGMSAEKTAELFVLYLDPARRRQGIGTLLLNSITKEQIETYGAQEQWVSVDEHNQKGIPFYKAMGFIVQDRMPSYSQAVTENYYSLRYKREL